MELLRFQMQLPRIHFGTHLHTNQTGAITQGLAEVLKVGVLAILINHCYTVCILIDHCYTVYVHCLITPGLTAILYVH
jgi:hypothetical protein